MQCPSDWPYRLNMVKYPVMSSSEGTTGQSGQTNSLFKWAPTNFKVNSIHSVPLKAPNGSAKWPDLAQPVTVWSGTTWGGVWNYVWNQSLVLFVAQKWYTFSFKFNITKCYLLCQQGHIGCNWPITANYSLFSSHHWFNKTEGGHNRKVVISPHFFFTINYF